MRYRTLIRHVLHAVPAWVVVGFFAAQYVYALPSAAALFAPLIASPSMSYGAKMESRLGDYYALIRFVEQHTPEDAAVLFDSPGTGNREVYFLYPRRLFYGGAETLRQHPEIEYVVVDGDPPDVAVAFDTIMLDDRRGLYRLRR